MDFKELAKVADSFDGSKRHVTAEVRQVIDEKNPLDALEEREKISDSKTVIIDAAFIKRLSNAPRDVRRKFLGRLSDSQRRRVLSLLKKHRVQDSGFSETLGFILLDDLLANAIYDPTEENIESLDYFIKTQNYAYFSDSIMKLVEQVKSGDDSLDSEAIDELSASIAPRASRVQTIVGEKESLDEDFQIPEEEDLTDEDIATLGDAAKKNVDLLLKNRSFKEILDAADDLLADMQGKNRRYSESSNVYWKAFEDAWKEQNPEGQKFATNTSEETEEIVDSLNNVLESITDDGELDTIFDNPATDENGEVVRDVEEEPIMELLAEALSEYAHGDDSKLEALSQQTINGDTVSEDNIEYMEEPSEEPDSPIEEEEPSEEQVHDSVVRLARRIIQGKRANKLIDSLKPKVSALRSINFKKCDCVAPFNEVPSEVSTINMPLSREEFYSIYSGGIPAVMVDILGNLEKQEVPPISSCEVVGNCVDINNGQLYYPYTCSAEELEERLNNAEKENLQEIVSSCAVPLEDAMKVAAQCEALHLIDTRFYKSSLSDSAWTFDKDSVPSIIGDSELTHLKRSSKEDSNIEIFGIPYKMF